jgi:fermentation-respiration switch protein FrsA (DUF1100 family)
MPLTPGLFETEYEELRIKSGENTLYGWHLKSSIPRKGAVLFFHGNGGNISLQLFSVFWLPWYGYDVFTFDYSGYGLSNGEPDLETIHRDARVMMEWTAAHTPETEPLYLFAQSLGGAVAVTALAHFPQKERFTKLIIDSTFAGYETIAEDAMQGSWITWPFSPLASFFDYAAYDPKNNIAAVAPIPILIIHGTADTIVAPSHAATLFDAAKEPKSLWLIEGTGHIGAFYDKTSRQELVRRMEQRP